MSVSPLLPAAGIAAAALARGAVAAVGNGLSFASELLRPSPAPEPAEVSQKLPTAEEFQAALREFTARLQAKLAVAGVGSSSALELVSDGLGGVQVSGDHPDRANIEQAINGDPALLAQFQQLADQCRQLIPQSRETDRRDFGLIVAGDEVQPFLK